MLCPEFCSDWSLPRANEALWTNAALPWMSLQTKTSRTERPSLATCVLLLPAAYKSSSLTSEIRKCRQPISERGCGLPPLRVPKAPGPGLRDGREELRRPGCAPSARMACVSAHLAALLVFDDADAADGTIMSWREAAVDISNGIISTLLREPLIELCGYYRITRGSVTTCGRLGVQHLFT
ncbi:hypothetical protein CSOJ01_08042 [Colletotrichum sojae]|uniref:Uncharacterized protein n=1 Tax=Colletotrichum sojae TaxID=2175907 RepID=A0A8H6MTH2_9PEZI|nr:hypothetical protein CSOJ01_08042 [Colletotrichum sojae]